MLNVKLFFFFLFHRRQLSRAPWITPKDCIDVQSLGVVVSWSSDSQGGGWENSEGAGGGCGF